MKSNLIRKFGLRFINRLKGSVVKQIPIANSVMHNDIWSSDQIKDVLLRTSLNGNSHSINDEVNLMTTAPSSHTVIRRLKRDESEDVLLEINSLIQLNFEKLCNMKKYSKKYPIYLVVDGHYEPYYGEKRPWISYSKRKKSTSWFVGVVALYVVHPGRPLLLGLSPLIENSEPKTAKVLLQQVKDLLQDYHIIFLADGLYPSLDLVGYLKDQNYDYLIRIARRSRIKEYCETPRAQSLGVSEGFLVRYKMKRKRKGGGRLWTYLLIANKRTTHGHRYDSKKPPDIYAWITSMPRSGAKRLLNLYKRRFRIENAFRDMRPFLIISCSKDKNVKFQLLWWAILVYYYLELFMLTDAEITNQERLGQSWFLKKQIPQRGIIANSYLAMIPPKISEEEVKL